MRRIETASVVVLVYSHSVAGSFERLSSFWIPAILDRTDKVGPAVSGVVAGRRALSDASPAVTPQPIVVVGNMSDLREDPSIDADPTQGEGSRAQALQEQMQPILTRFEVRGVAEGVGGLPARC